MPWWGWVLLGVLMLAGEAAVDAQFFLLFSGAAALIIGLAGAFGLEGEPWQEWLSFGVLSVVFLVTFRARVYGRFAEAQGVAPELIGEFAVPGESLAPGATGRAELRGSTWTAQNVGDSPIEAGQRVRVVRVSGLTVEVKAEEPS